MHGAVCFFGSVPVSGAVLLPAALDFVRCFDPGEFGGFGFLNESHAVGERVHRDWTGQVRSHAGALLVVGGYHCGIACGLLRGKGRDSHQMLTETAQRPAC